MNRGKYKLTAHIAAILLVVAINAAWFYHARREASFIGPRDTVIMAALGMLFGGLVLSLSKLLEQKKLARLVRFIGIWNLWGGALLAVAALFLALVR